MQNSNTNARSVLMSTSAKLLDFKPQLSMSAVAKQTATN
jgi:hypothetical protein